MNKNLKIKKILLTSVSLFAFGMLNDSTRAAGVDKYTSTNSDVTDITFFDNPTLTGVPQGYNEGDAIIYTGNHIITYNANADFGVAAVNFNGTDGVFYLSADGNGMGTVATTTIPGKGIIALDKDFYYYASIGDATNPIAKIRFDADVLFTYRGSDTDEFLVFTNEIAPSEALGSGNGTFMSAFGTAQFFDINFGTADRKLKRFAFSPYYDEAVLTIEATLKEGRKIYANIVDVYPQEGQAISSSKFFIEGNTLIDGDIRTLDGSGIGNIYFEGSSIVTGTIGLSESGKLDSVTFQSGDIKNVVSLGGSIHTKTITQDETTVKLTNNITFDSAYSGSSSAIDIGQFRLTQAGSNGEMTGSGNITFTASDTASGSILADGVVFTINNPLNLNLVDISKTIPDGSIVDKNGNRIRRFTIFSSANDGEINIPDDENVNYVILSSTNPFVQWTYSKGVITQLVSPPALDQIIEDAQQQIDAPEAQANFANIVNNATPESGLQDLVLNALSENAINPVLNRLQPVITEVTESIFDAIQDVYDALLNRINATTPSLLFADASNELTGISAGDEDKMQFGSWASYSHSYNFQKAINNSPGYISRANIGSVGVDTKIDEDKSVGFALSFARTDVHHKDANQGDKTTTDSFAASLYGVKEFFNGWYIEGISLLSKSKIENMELRQGPNSRIEIARAKFSSYALGFELLTAYSYVTQNNVTISPMIGCEYNRISKTDYQETGTTNQNLKVTKRPDNKLEAIIGMRAGKNYELKKYTISPEIHGFIRRDVLNRKLRITASLDGLPDPFILRTTEQSSAFYNIGTSIATTALYDSKLELVLDSYFAKKYIGVTGTVKLRLDL